MVISWSILLDSYKTNKITYKANKWLIFVYFYSNSVSAMIMMEKDGSTEDYKIFLKNYKKYQQNYSIVTFFEVESMISLSWKLWTQSDRVISVALFLCLKGGKRWNLQWERKKYLLCFGGESRKLTHERLGLACVCITDVLAKVAANSLRNKIYNLTCDRWYIKMYHCAKEELNYSRNGGYVAWLDYWFKIQCLLEKMKALLCWLIGHNKNRIRLRG